MPSKPVVIGRLCGLYGIQGWLKVYSYTQPREGVFSYQPWQLTGQEVQQVSEIASWRWQGKGLIVKLAGIDERATAARLVDSDISVAREALPPAAEDEYYWADLEGLRVVTREGVVLGQVDYLFDNGANDVLVVRGERLRMLPFDLDQVIRRIDLTAQEMEVDWDPQF